MISYGAIVMFSATSCPFSSAAKSTVAVIGFSRRVGLFIPEGEAPKSFLTGDLGGSACIGAETAGQRYEFYQRVLALKLNHSRIVDRTHHGDRLAPILGYSHYGLRIHKKGRQSAKYRPFYLLDGEAAGL